MSTLRQELEANKPQETAAERIDIILKPFY
jgi:hypothetical protein